MDEYFEKRRDQGFVGPMFQGKLLDRLFSIDGGIMWIMDSGVVKEKKNDSEAGLEVMIVDQRQQRNRRTVFWLRKGKSDGYTGRR